VEGQNKKDLQGLASGQEAKKTELSCTQIRAKLAPATSLPDSKNPDLSPHPTMQHAARGACLSLVHTQPKQAEARHAGTWSGIQPCWALGCFRSQRIGCLLALEICSCPSPATSCML
jgi:hypothetical protein